MNWITLPLVFLFIAVPPYQAARGESAKVSGGFGCDRKSGYAICFPDDGRCVCGFVIGINGEIDFTTADQVGKLFEIWRSHNNEGATSFWIDSPGGNVAAAMAIGRMFRKERAHIQVSNNCVSACVMILAGAVERIVLGKVGIHRPYLEIPPQNKSPSVDELKSAYERILQNIRAYLREMNGSERLADEILAAKSSGTNYARLCLIEKHCPVSEGS